MKTKEEVTREILDILVMHKIKPTQIEFDMIAMSVELYANSKCNELLDRQLLRGILKSY